MNKLVLLLALLLAGCASAPPITIVPPDKVVRVDPKLIQSCPSLVEIPSGTKDFADVLEVLSVNNINYSICRNKQEASIRLIKDLANIK